MEKSANFEDVVALFVELIETENKVQTMRLAGQDFKFERTRAERLETKFNQDIRSLPRDEQLKAVDRLIELGHFPASVRDTMDTFGGTFHRYGTDHRKVAMDVLDSIKTAVPKKDALALAEHSLKHMGFGWNDYYAILGEIKKILRITN